MDGVPGKPVVIYADNFQIHVSTATIAIEFSRSEAWEGPEAVQPVAVVQLSPMSFKMLTQAFPDLLAEYEQRVGSIEVQMPPQSESNDEGSHE